MGLFLLVLVWGLWCAGHSGLITLRAQSFFSRRFPARFRFYRLAYNGFALVSILPVLVLSHSMRTDLLFSWQGWGLIPWAVLWVLVLGLGYLGARAYDMDVFTGLRQIREPSAEKGPPPPLTRTGILAVVRHPWYLAALILFWIRARDIFVSTAVENLVLTLYIFIGIRLEERKLIRIYGQAYRTYKKTVPALLPLPGKKS